MTTARHLRPPVLAVSALGLLISTAGCVRSDGPSLVDSLVGHRFVAVGSTGFELPPASSLSITFDDPGGEDHADGRIGVSGGCNLIGGAFTIGSGDTLRAVDGWIQTEMACDEPLMALDNDVITLLDAAPRLSVEGTTLTIESAGTSLTLEQE